MRGLNVDTAALYSANLTRNWEEEMQEEERPRMAIPFATKIRASHSSQPLTRLGSRITASTSRPSPAVVMRNASFSNEVQARIAAQRLEDKIREAALKRAMYR